MCEREGGGGAKESSVDPDRWATKGKGRAKETKRWSWWDGECTVGDGDERRDRSEGRLGERGKRE